MNLLLNIFGFIVQNELKAAELASRKMVQSIYLLCILLVKQLLQTLSVIHTKKVER